MVDAGMGAFAVFFTQSPSFLAYQDAMNQKVGKKNAESLLGMEKVPCDNQTRTQPDPVEPSSVARVFRDIFRRLERTGVLKDFRAYANYLLFPMDGTYSYSSQNIHCDNRNHRELSNGKINMRIAAD